MILRTIPFAMAAAGIFVSAAACSQEQKGAWQEEFDIANCKLLTTGKAPYFVLEPGFQFVLESDDATLQITVLDETRTIDGVETRVIEEREWKDGKLFEVSRNYFAMCEQTKDVFYFGEDVDFYENDKVVKHDGSWLAGTDGSKAGLMMSGSPKVGMKYFQEVAPGVAMDRAEIISIDETCETPAGRFAKCMKVKEGTALNVFEVEYKYHAPEIGLVADESLRLVKYGFVSQ